MANAPHADILDVHRTGWSLDAISNDWEPEDQAAVINREGWDDAVAIDEVNNDLTGSAGPSDAGVLFIGREMGRMRKEWMRTKSRTVYGTYLSRLQTSFVDS